MTTKNILDHLTGKEVTDALTEVMASHFEDFAQARRRCDDSVSALRSASMPDDSPSVEDEMEAIRRQTASNLLYSGFLGLKANLDNFIDPTARDFLDTDCETYLRENLARHLPEYESAQQTRDRFFAGLTPAQRELHEGIRVYVSHLETVGPKLAHYFGYLLGNELLRRIVPGYRPDMVQTIRYRMMLEDYFGKPLDLR